MKMALHASIWSAYGCPPAIYCLSEYSYIPLASAMAYTVPSNWLKWATILMDYLDDESVVLLEETTT